MIYLFFVTLVFLPTQAYAYFDPGTGSMLIQIAVGALAGVAVFWKKIKTFILSRLGKKNSQDNQSSENQ